MSTSVAWEHELQSWLEPFLTHLHHPARRRMCPLYVAGLIGPGERKSLQPIAARLAPADYDQLHHFIAVGPWDDGPREAELLAQADRLAPVSARGLDEGSRTHAARGRAGRIPLRTLQARGRAG